MITDAENIGQMTQPKQSVLEDSISALTKSISGLELEIAKLSPQKDLVKEGNIKVPIKKSFSELVVFLTRYINGT